MTKKFHVELFDSRNTSTPQIDLDATNIIDAIAEVLDQDYWSFIKAYIGCSDKTWTLIDSKGNIMAHSL